MAVGLAAHAPGGDAFHLLHSGVDNPALIRVHGFQGGAPSGAGRLASHLLGQADKGLLPLFAVIADVDGDPVIGVVHPVGDQAGEILQRVQGIPPAADDKAQVLALQTEGAGIFLFLDGDGGAADPHALQNAVQIGRRGGGGGNFNIRAHLGGAAAEKAERLFLRHLQDFELQLVFFKPQLGRRRPLGFFQRGRFLNGFFQHASSVLSLIRDPDRSSLSDLQNPWAGGRRPASPPARRLPSWSFPPSWRRRPPAF